MGTPKSVWIGARTDGETFCTDRNRAAATKHKRYLHLFVYSGRDAVFVQVLLKLCPGDTAVAAASLDLGVDTDELVAGSTFPNVLGQVEEKRQLLVLSVCGDVYE
jgi:hypothetical protein